MRYERLAEYAGLTDSDHARGKMMRLWRQCTLEQRHVLPECDVVRVLGPNGPRAIHDAGLGEIVANGVRIRGTKGRIEWLKKLRANGKYGSMGGRPKRTQKGSPGNPRGLAKQGADLTPPAPAPAPSEKNTTLSGVKPPDVAKVEKVKVEKVEPPEAVELATLLADAVTRRMKDTPKGLLPDKRDATIAKWAREFRLAHEADKRSWERLRKVLEWSQAHSFWATNIRSGDKFREQFDALAARMDAPQEKSGGKPQAEPPKYKDEGYVS